MLRTPSLLWSRQDQGSFFVAIQTSRSQHHEHEKQELVVEVSLISGSLRALQSGERTRESWQRRSVLFRVSPAHPAEREMDLIVLVMTRPANALFWVPRADHGTWRTKNGERHLYIAGFGFVWLRRSARENQKGAPAG